MNAESTSVATGLHWPLTVVMIVAGLLVLVGLFVFVTPVDPNDFESTTGVAWQEFEASAPEVADYLEREARLLAAGWSGVGLFALVAAAKARRTPARELPAVLWVLPGALAAGAVVFVTGDGLVPGATYGAAAIGAAVSLLAARRT
ncbi:MAG: hypothetical protein R3249_04090 [Nitriliruptorales bacterium]|nr:hypothetical protein [Nitriliruptorales bacterium]